MRRRTLLGAALVLVTVPSALAAGPASEALSLPVPTGFRRSDLVFEDFFEGTRLDTHWVPYIASRGSDGRPWNGIGLGGSGLSSPASYSNQEYDLPSQVRVDDGLTLRAVRRPTRGGFGNGTRVFPWRSGVVSTYGRFEFTGGYVQVWAKVPAGSGFWPAIWLLPGPRSDSLDSFEIDLFEGGYVARRASPGETYAWHLHTPRGVVGGVTATGISLSEGFHLFGLRWKPGRSLTWYLDGRQVGEVDEHQATIPDQPMVLIFNLGVAAPGTARFHSVPDRSTPSSGDFDVRAVEVYA